tara:strand:- start:103 stop:684 length:582 start_codon:yes stop_codon:yes gene_type:complete
MEEKIKDCMFRINNLVPKKICNELIYLFENNKKYTYSHGSYKFKTDKFELDNFSCINLSKLVEIDKSFKEPFDIVARYISIMITNYVLHIKKNICPSFNNFHIKRTNNIRILKYEKNQYIKDHSDVDPTIRASCTLNLNEDYEGGEFRFFDGKIKQSFKTGDSILFPAEPIWIHGTEKITKGIRYSINCFLQE